MLVITVIIVAQRINIHYKMRITAYVKSYNFKKIF